MAHIVLPSVNLCLPDSTLRDADEVAVEIRSSMEAAGIDPDTVRVVGQTMDCKINGLTVTPMRFVALSQAEERNQESRLAAKLEALGACSRGMEWARKLPRNATLRQAWDACPEASWLAWLVYEAMAAAPPCGRCSPDPNDQDCSADEFRAKWECPQSVPERGCWRFCDACSSPKCGCGGCHECLEDDDYDENEENEHDGDDDMCSCDDCESEDEDLESEEVHDGTASCLCEACLLAYEDEETPDPAT